MTMTMTMTMTVALAPNVVHANVAGETVEAQTLPKTTPSEGAFVPDTGSISLGRERYRDPAQPGEMWAGIWTGGVAVPGSIAPGDDWATAARLEGAWAARLNPWVSLEGRHGAMIYTLVGTRLQVHEHHAYMAFNPGRKLLQSGISDRLAFGVEVHRLVSLKLDEDGEWLDFAIGGVRDVVLTGGYGMEYQLGKRWAVSWALQGRYTWVFTSTQRGARLASRLSFRPKRGHELGVEAMGYAIHRDEAQFGSADLARASMSGSFDAVYQWMGKRKLGVEVRGRAMTSVMNGEAPLYEVQAEVLRYPFAELLVGLQYRAGR